MMDAGCQPLDQSCFTDKEWLLFHSLKQSFTLATSKWEDMRKEGKVGHFFCFRYSGFSESTQPAAQLVPLDFQMILPLLAFAPAPGSFLVLGGGGQWGQCPSLLLVDNPD